MKDKQDELWANAHLWYPRVKKRFPRYGVPMWNLWPNIRFLPSIVAEKNATNNVHMQMYVKCAKNQQNGQTEIRNKGNNKITELRTILQRESPNS